MIPLYPKLIDAQVRAGTTTTPETELFTVRADILGVSAVGRRFGQRRAVMTGQKPISADSHVNEPANLWLERIDQKFRDRAPRIADNLPGRPPGSYLVLEDIPPVHLSQGLGAGKTAEELPAFFRSSTYKGARRGGWDPAERLKDMDLDGVQAEVLYGGGPLPSQDAGLRRAS